jgi:hypothetical protein
LPYFLKKSNIRQIQLVSTALVAERGCWRDTTSAQDMSTSSSRAQAPASSDKVSYTMHRSSGRTSDAKLRQLDPAAVAIDERIGSAQPGRLDPSCQLLTAPLHRHQHQLPPRGLLPGRRPERLQLAKLIRGSDVLTKSKHLSDSRSRPYDATGWLPVRASSESPSPSPSPSPSRACPHPDLDRSCAGSRLRLRSYCVPMLLAASSDFLATLVW